MGKICGKKWLWVENPEKKVPLFKNIRPRIVTNLEMTSASLSMLGLSAGAVWAICFFFFFFFVLGSITHSIMSSLIYLENRVSFCSRSIFFLQTLLRLNIWDGKIMPAYPGSSLATWVFWNGTDMASWKDFKPLLLPVMKEERTPAMSAQAHEQRPLFVSLLGLSAIDTALLVTVSPARCMSDFWPTELLGSLYFF